VELTTVLDAWAVIALLQREPAWQRVFAAMESGDARISWVNLSEVLYIQSRRIGAERATAAVTRLRHSAIVEDAGEDVALAAAAIKAETTISLADCFAVATAERHRAPLLTGDPELVELDRPNLEVVNLRR
jgi:ribonuclease VapC